VPTITSTNGLEYKLTTAIQKLNHKVSALLALEEDVKATLVLSSSLYKVAPYMNIQGLEKYPDKIKAVVDEMNSRTYGKLNFHLVDPSNDTADREQLEKFDLMRIKWKDVPNANLPAGEATMGMLLQYKDKTSEIPLLRVVRLPIFGDQYQLTEPDEVQELINTNLERLININEEIGYLADFGTLTLGASPLGPQGDAASAFNTVLDKTYSVKRIYLKEANIPEGLKTMIIAQPTEQFSDYALYQIDQALMRGTNLALFVDMFQEQQQNQGLMMGRQQMQFHVPLNTGLEKLLAHYGVRIKQAYVMDEECYRQRRPRQQGGGEQPVYFAPIIQNQNINKELDYLKNIKGLIALQVSPLELDDQRISEQQLTAHQLFSSSDRSWEMRDRIILNPMFISPPASDNEMGSRPLAYLVEGTFTSYFKGKPMPEKPAEEKTEGQGAEDEATPSDEGAEHKKVAVDLDKVAGAFREKSIPAKIFVLASGKMLGNQLIDPDGRGTNSVFTINMIDALSGRADVAVMRSKEQQINPLHPTSATTKLGIKSATMAGLPIVVILFGLIVWWRRHMHRKAIQAAFRKPAAEA
ncbi:MAG: ABC transporter permease, partial [Desulfatitalea sp.]|nr:Gldg family protein [Desulfatitalea sp.]NNK01366.1 ABC transporter permease [Desulfatitalea sp.]